MGRSCASASARSSSVRWADSRRVIHSDSREDLLKTIGFRGLALACLLATWACHQERSESIEQEAFSFTVYPGSRYLSQLTELTKQAHQIAKPSEEPPATAIY